MDKLIKLCNNHIKEMLLEAFEVGDFQVVVENSNTWDFELPPQLINEPILVLDIKGWAHEQSSVMTDGFYVKTAFGEEEFSKTFPFDNIVGINVGNTVVYQKTFRFYAENEPNFQGTQAKVVNIQPPIQKMPKGVTDEGIKNSMDKMLAKNSKFTRKS